MKGRARQTLPGSVDEADIFAISGIIALGLALVLVNLLPFTNVWVAGIAVLGLPLVTITLAIAIGKAINWRWQPTQPLTEAAKEDSHEGAHLTAADFLRAWLNKSRRVARAGACSMDADCPPGYICVNGHCEPA